MIKYISFEIILGTCKLKKENVFSEGYKVSYIDKFSHLLINEYVRDLGINKVTLHF